MTAYHIHVLDHRTYRVTVEAESMEDAVFDVEQCHDIPGTYEEMAEEVESEWHIDRDQCGPVMEYDEGSEK